MYGYAVFGGLGPRSVPPREDPHTHRPRPFAHPASSLLPPMTAARPGQSRAPRAKGRPGSATRGLPNRRPRPSPRAKSRKPNPDLQVRVSWLVAQHLPSAARGPAISALAQLWSWHRLPLGSPRPRNLPIPTKKRRARGVRRTHAAGRARQRERPEPAQPRHKPRPHLQTADR